MGVLTPADENGGGVGVASLDVSPGSGAGRSIECCTHDLRRGLLSFALRALQTVKLQVFSEELPSPLDWGDHSRRATDRLTCAPAVRCGLSTVQSQFEMGSDCTITKRTAPRNGTNCFVFRSPTGKDIVPGGRTTGFAIAWDCTKASSAPSSAVQTDIAARLAKVTQLGASMIGDGE